MSDKTEGKARAKGFGLLHEVETMIRHIRTKVNRARCDLHVVRQAVEFGEVGYGPTQMHPDKADKVLREVEELLEEISNL